MGSYQCGIGQVGFTLIITDNLDSHLSNFYFQYVHSGLQNSNNNGFGSIPLSKIFTYESTVTLCPAL